MAKSRRFRVAVEGATTDGRVIEASWIQEMAANYDQATYTARVNMEHLRGYSPEPPFNSYGTVTALHAEQIDLTVAGKTEKKWALFAEIDANDQLKAVNKKGQKLYTSVEVNPNFAGKGQAYLVGLAVTDSPASLGTEMLQFAAKAEHNPLAARKQHPDNLFTATSDAVQIELVDDAGGADGGAGSLSDLLASALRKFTGEKPAEPSKPAEPEKPAGDIQATAQLAEVLKTFGDATTAAVGRIEAAMTADRAAVAQLTSEVSSLKGQLDRTPNTNHSHRPLATGGDAAVVTDC